MLGGLVFLKGALQGGVWNRRPAARDLLGIGEFILIERQLRIGKVQRVGGARSLPGQLRDAILIRRGLGFQLIDARDPGPASGPALGGRYDAACRRAVA